MPRKVPMSLKKEALQRYANGQAVKDIAGALQISMNSVYIWAKQFGVPPANKVNYDPQARIKELEAENERLKELAAYAPLPDWAIGMNFAKDLEVGTQLLTKDGRKTGNARIESITNIDSPVYRVRTDIGNSMMMSTNEINELFYIGPYFIEDQRTHNGWQHDTANID